MYRASAVATADQEWFSARAITERRACLAPARNCGAHRNEAAAGMSFKFISNSLGRMLRFLNQEYKFRAEAASYHAVISRSQPAPLVRALNSSLPLTAGRCIRTQRRSKSGLRSFRRRARLWISSTSLCKSSPGVRSSNLHTHTPLQSSDPRLV
jgi:hypothetical protein